MIKKILSTIIALLFTICLSAQILVIPDVHGRRFWKEATDKYPHLPVIFLGDYLDPYARENISSKEALANFKEILAFKQANKDRVTLLIGNHEIHYLDNTLRFSRKDTLHADYIHLLLLEHLPYFSIATQAKIGGKTFLFTHAGLTEKWWRRHFPNTPTDIQSICSALNGKMKNEKSIEAFIDDALMDIGKERGGKADAGSCVWADLNEHSKQPWFLNGIYQVFGHTQLKKKAVIRRTFADLDCRRAFLIESQGNIKEIK